MKVIFLDVDGVLNNAKWATQTYDEEHISVFYERLLYPKALRVLKLIVDATQAEIVVSSTWRKDPQSLELLRTQLRSVGLDIFDVTPSTAGDRGQDITAWFDANKLCPIESYVILDDDSDIGEHKHHLIQTTFESGLLPRHAELAIAMLNDV